jgi:hypothetical protein
MTQEALDRIAEKLRRAGANLPAPEVTGTIEGSVVTGLCIALALVESETEALAQPEQEPPKYSFKAHWEKDGRIGVVGAVVRPDGGVHLLQDIIDPPQRTEPVACERCKQLEEHAYDLVGKLRVANIKLSMNKEQNT